MEHWPATSPRLTGSSPPRFFIWYFIHFLAGYLDANFGFRIESHGRSCVQPAPVGAHADWKNSSIAATQLVSL